jgi:hypothetical protein
MKAILLTIITITALSFGVNAQNVYIPDVNFKSLLLNHGVTITGSGISLIDLNTDGHIQVSEANAYTGTIQCSSGGITSMVGIEEFTALTSLYCHTNNITSIDISNNTALTILECFDNIITNLNVSNNTALTSLACGANNLTSIDISNNTALTRLECSGNSITSLDVSNNSALTYLYCIANLLTSLNVSSNTALTHLECYFNQLDGLDISANTALTILKCNDNNLTSLDVTQNTALIFLLCDDNSLTSLNVANGNNTNIVSFLAYNNPNLTCITVDDVAHSTTYWTLIDAAASFSTNCFGTVGIDDVSVPNVNIYPNPVQKELFVDLEKGLISEIDIIDFSGKVVKSITSSNKKSIDVSALKKGIYFLQTQTKNGISNSKFIKE